MEEKNSWDGEGDGTQVEAGRDGQGTSEIGSVWVKLVYILSWRVSTDSLLRHVTVYIHVLLTFQGLML